MERRIGARLRRLGLVALALISSQALALQSGDPSARFNVGKSVADTQDEAEVGTFKVSRETATVTADYAPAFRAAAATPEAMALEYLRTRAGELNLEPSLADLVFHSTTETPGGFRVRYHQKVDGLEVDGADLVVSLDRDQNVIFYMSTYVGEASARRASRASWSLSAEDASARAAAHFGTRAARSKRQEKVWAFHEGRLVPAYRVLTDAEHAEWQSLVDARDGSLIQVKSNTHHARAETVTGAGMVFDPDPLTKNHKVKTDVGYGDANDADTAQLTASRLQVPLELTRNGGNFELSGTYAKINDFEAPSTGIFAQASDQFMFTRQQPPFEAVNAYYHVQKSMAYINETLGHALRPYQNGGLVLIDPQGLNGDDNSYYQGGQLVFGEGGVDDAEDEDVVLHELGHGLHDWLTRGHLSQVQGLSEGCGDYWAASYNRSFGLWAKTDPQYFWTFQWDGHNEFWPGRVLNIAGKYPAAAGGEIHSGGQLWATTLMDIYDVIGREATDKLFLEALSMLGSSANQLDAANAFARADRTLYQGAHMAVITARFAAHGFTITAI